MQLVKVDSNRNRRRHDSESWRSKLKPERRQLY
jgi:hypothetical protein